MDKVEYRKYIDKNVSQNEGFQDGVRYISIDLFSKLKTSEYIDNFIEAGFLINDLWVEISGSALKFLRSYPDFFDRAVIDFNISKIDCLIKSHHIKLSKPII